MIQLKLLKWNALMPIARITGMQINEFLHYYMKAKTATVQFNKATSVIFLLYAIYEPCVYSA
jgi:hypothetical protein